VRIALAGGGAYAFVIRGKWGGSADVEAEVPFEVEA